MNYKRMIVLIVAASGMLHISPVALGALKTTCISLAGTKLSSNYTFQVQNDEQMRLLHVIADGEGKRFAGLLQDAIEKDKEVINKKFDANLMISLSDGKEGSGELSTQMTLMDWFVAVHTRKTQDKFDHYDGKMFRMTKELFFATLSEDQQEIFEVLQQQGAQPSEHTDILAGVVEPLAVVKG